MEEALQGVLLYLLMDPQCLELGLALWVLLILCERQGSGVFHFVDRAGASSGDEGEVESLPPLTRENQEGQGKGLL